MSLTLGGSSTYRSLSHMSSTKAKMDKSLQRISSGQRILSASDDPGGLAVAMKLKSQISSYDAQKDSVENAKSYVESQSTALQTIRDCHKNAGSQKVIMTILLNSRRQNCLRIRVSGSPKTIGFIEGRDPEWYKIIQSTDGDMTVSSVTLTNLDLDAKLQNNDS